MREDAVPTSTPARLRRVASVLTAAVLLATPTLPAWGAAPGTAARTRTPPPPERVLTGWLPYWTTATLGRRVPSNADLFTEVSPFWHTARWDSAAGRIYVDEYLPAAQRDAALARIRTAGRRVVPSVTDSTGWRRMATLMGDPGRRSAHVRQLVDLVLTQGYDGVDLDYETFAFTDGVSSWATTRVGWIRFIRELGAALHARGKLLTVTVPPMCDVLVTCGGAPRLLGLRGRGDRPQHRPPADHDLRLLVGPARADQPRLVGGGRGRVRRAAHPCSEGPDRGPDVRPQLGSPRRRRRGRGRGHRGVPAHGVLPLHRLGRRSPGVAGVLGHHRKAEHSSAAIPDLRARRGYPTVHWDARAKEKWFRYSLSTTWTDDDGAARTCTAHREVWFPDAASLAARVRLVGRLGLGGIALWTIGGEDDAQWDRVRRYARSIAPPVPKVAVWAPSVLVYGQRTRVVVRALVDGRPVPGARVDLMRRSGTAPWRVVHTGLLDRDGRARFTVRPTTTTVWRAVVPGAGDRRGGDSGSARTTGVRPVVRATLPRPVVRTGIRFPLHARVAPAVAGHLVRIQLKRVGTGWTTTAVVRTDADGRVRATLPSAQSPGRWWYRVVPAATPTRLPGYSRPMLLRTR